MSFVDHIRKQVRDTVRGETPGATLRATLDAAELAPKGFMVMILSIGISEALKQIEERGE
jgi:hypothetical protein